MSAAPMLPPSAASMPVLQQGKQHAGVAGAGLAGYEAVEAAGQGQWQLLEADLLRWMPRPLTAKAGRQARWRRIARRLCFPPLTPQRSAAGGRL